MVKNTIFSTTAGCSISTVISSPISAPKRSSPVRTSLTRTTAIFGVAGTVGSVVALSLTTSPTKMNFACSTRSSKLWA